MVFLCAGTGRRSDGEPMRVHESERPVHLNRKMTYDDYVKIVGVPPIDDDLDRVNCGKVGQVGHEMCGWNPLTQRPRFMGMGR